MQMSNTQQQRLVVEQLRREAAIKRITVRQAVADIMVTKKLKTNIHFFELVLFFFCLIEICFRSSAGWLSDGWIQFSKSKSIQREKQLLTVIILAKWMYFKTGIFNLLFCRIKTWMFFLSVLMLWTEFEKLLLKRKTSSPDVWCKGICVCSYRR